MSPTEKTLTERDAVLRERAAFANGAAWGPGWHRESDLDEAAKRYPLPKVIRPRVVCMGWSEARIVDGRVETRGLGGSGEWRANFTTVEQLRELASLIDNPTEEVEDVGGAS